MKRKKTFKTAHLTCSTFHFYRLVGGTSGILKRGLKPGGCPKRLNIVWMTGVSNQINPSTNLVE
jgi:hypothetical protein